MQIYIEYGTKVKHISYKAPAIPRIGEEICYEWPNENRIFYFEVQKISHYTDGDNYEVILKCKKLRASNE